jgi:hypothetical protein
LRFKQKFFHLWKDAGPGIAELEDGMKRLEVLRDNMGERTQ